MRILVTGATASQCGIATTLQLHNVGSIFADALRIAGHDVDHRAATLGEDVSGYDVMLLGMSSLGGLAARRLFIVMDLIMRARESGVKIVFFVDDWRIREIGNNIRTILREPSRLYVGGLKRPSSRIAPEWARDNIDSLMVLVKALDENPWPPTLIGVFGFATSTVHETILQKMLPSRHLVAVDPTPLTRTYDELTLAAPDVRRREWMNAALVENDTWTKRLGTTWPLIGFKRMARKAGEELAGNPRVPEHDLLARYAQTWGVLSAPYTQHVGSGYWRYRYVHAIRAGCVMVGDQREIGALEPYRYGPRQIETFTNDQLAWLAGAQRDAFLAASWDRDRLVTTIHDVITKEAV